MKDRIKWRRGILILLLFAAVTLFFPGMIRRSELRLSRERLEVGGTLEEDVYKRFYFQGGVRILPGSCLSYTWTYMEEGDSVRILVNGDGTLQTGICRFSDSKTFGMKQSGNFTVTMTVPSSGYYKVFITNPSEEMVYFKGMAVCSQS